MEKEFTPYEQALDLKKLGYDKPCFGHWVDGTLDLITRDINAYPPLYVEVIKAPTYSQVFRWFREKYNMFSHLDKNVYNKYYYDIHNRGEIFFREEYSDTPEEAELACLKKLIEIVKTLPQ